MIAIELQRDKVQELERQARQRKLDNTTRGLELKGQAPERQARRRKPIGTKRPELRAEMLKERDPGQILRDQETQRKHNEEYVRRREQQRGYEEAVRRIEQQRGNEEAVWRIEQRGENEQLEGLRKEQLRLQNPATIEGNWELWRSGAEERRVKQREQRVLRDEAGEKARGVGKRPAGSQPSAEPCVKRQLVGAKDRPSRYNYLH